MIELKVDVDRCSGCGLCVTHCPFEAIELVDGKAVVGEPCGRCVACTAICPEQAIQILRAPRQPAKRPALALSGQSSYVGPRGAESRHEAADRAARGDHRRG